MDMLNKLNTSVQVSDIPSSKTTLYRQEILKDIFKIYKQYIAFQYIAFFVSEKKIHSFENKSIWFTQYMKYKN